MAGTFVPPQAITVAFTQTSSFVPAYTPSSRQYVLDKTNPSWIRNAILTNDSLYLQYYTASGVIALSNLYDCISNVLPAIAWAPIITSQPTSSTVTHPASTSFVVVASQAPNAAQTMSYQWYSSSYSQSLSGAYSPLTYTGIFTGSLTPALTCSSTSVGMNNSQFFCIVKNVSGITTSSAAILTVL